MKIKLKLLKLLILLTIIGENDMSWYKKSKTKLTTWTTERHFTSPRYTDIGHGSKNDLAWALKDNMDLIVEPANESYHGTSKLHSLKQYEFCGRIDPDKKIISMCYPYNYDRENIKYVLNLLKTEFPGFIIHSFPY